VRDLLAEADPAIRLILLDVSASNRLDIKSLDTLRAMREELVATGRDLWLAGVHAAFYDMLKRGGLAEELGDGHLYPTVEQAVESFHARYPGDATPVPAAGQPGAEGR